MTAGSAWTSHGAVEVVDFSTFFDLDVDLLLDFFVSLGAQIFSTSAGRSSGGARATDAISEQILVLNLFLQQFSRKFSDVLVGAHFEHQLKLYSDSFLFH